MNNFNAVGFTDFLFFTCLVIYPIIFRLSVIFIALFYSRNIINETIQYLPQCDNNPPSPSLMKIKTKEEKEKVHMYSKYWLLSIICYIFANYFQIIFFRKKKNQGHANSPEFLNSFHFQLFPSLVFKPCFVLFFFFFFFYPFIFMLYLHSWFSICR